MKRFPRYTEPMTKAQDATNELPPVASVTGAGCLSVFGLPFLLAGVFILLVSGGWWKTWWDAGSWARVPVTIDALKMITSRGSKGAITYRVTCSYSYRYDAFAVPGGPPRADAPAFSGTRVGPEGVGADTDQQQSRYQTLAAYRAAQKPFLAYVNPDDPSAALLFRDPGLGMYLVPLLAIMFGSIGLFFVLGGVDAVGGYRRRIARVATDPGRPWRWEDTWSQGFSITGSLGRRFRIAATACAPLVLYLLPATSGLVQSTEPPNGGFICAGIAGVFLAVLLVRATVLGLRFRRYGVIRLELDELPVVPGRALTGRVVTDGRVEANRLKLWVIARRTFGSGKQQRQVEAFRIEDISGADLLDRSDESAFPVNVALPAGAPPHRISSPRLDWTLEVTAPGFSEVFALPVFITAEPERRPGSPVA